MRITDDRQLLLDEINFIRKHQGGLLLSFCDKDFTFVKLILMDNVQHRIVSPYCPIRFGRHLGSEVILGGIYNNTDMSPTFYYDAIQNLWRLDCKGYVVFPEIEINYEKEGRS